MNPNQMNQSWHGLLKKLNIPKVVGLYQSITTMLEQNAEAYTDINSYFDVSDHSDTLLLIAPYIVEDEQVMSGSGFVDELSHRVINDLRRTCDPHLVFEYYKNEFEDELPNISAVFGLFFTELKANLLKRTEKALLPALVQESKKEFAKKTKQFGTMEYQEMIEIFPDSIDKLIYAHALRVVVDKLKLIQQKNLNKAVQIIVPAHIDRDFTDNSYFSLLSSQSATTLQQFVIDISGRIKSLNQTDYKISRSFVCNAMIEMVLLNRILDDLIRQQSNNKIQIKPENPADTALLLFVNRDYYVDIYALGHITGLWNALDIQTDTGRETITKKMSLYSQDDSSKANQIIAMHDLLASVVPQFAQLVEESLKTV